MISILIFVFTMLVLGSFSGVFKLSRYKNDKGETSPKQIIKLFIVFLISLLVLIFQPISIQRIDAGSVGVKVDRIGDKKGIPQARSVKGWVWYTDWTTDVLEYSIRQNHVEYPAFVVTTKGGFPMKVSPSFNYSLKPEKAVDLYINLLKGGDFSSLKDNFIRTATELALNNASNKFPIDSIFNNKEGYNTEVARELNRELSAYFVVTQINPGSVAPPELAEVIKAKTEAVQKAQQAELDKLTAEADAATKIAKAKGDSAALVIDAKAQAEAIRQKQREITSNYIEYIKWNSWNGVLPSTILGTGTNILFNKN